VLREDATLISFNSFISSAYRFCPDDRIKKLKIINWVKTNLLVVIALSLEKNIRQVS
jgi:hypothetical protein